MSTTKMLVSANTLIERIDALKLLLRPTPIAPLETDRIRLFAKLEYQNPFGSLKDRSAFWVLREAIARCEVTSDTTLIESSSGNFASAMAFLAQALGLRFIPVVDPNITEAYDTLLRGTCERVVRVEKRDESGGFLTTRLSKVQELLSEIPGALWTNQYENLDNMRGHYELTGAEICSAFDQLDYVFVGVSTGGTIAGVSQRVKAGFPGVKVIAVDAEGSVIFDNPPKRRFIPGLGSSIKPPLVSKAIIDDVVIVPEIDAVKGCHELLHEHGLFAGGSSGAVYAAIKKFFKRSSIGRPPNVLFLCADRGNAYANTVYNPVWTERLRQH